MEQKKRVQITRDQLVEGLARLENWEKREDWGCLCPQDYPAPTKQESEEFGAPAIPFDLAQCFAARWPKVGGRGLALNGVGKPLYRDPTSDIGEAMRLFLSLRFPTLEPQRNGWKVGWGQATGEANQGTTWLEFDPFSCPLSDEEQVALTACVAKYEREYGVLVEKLELKDGMYASSGLGRY